MINGSDELPKLMCTDCVLQLDSAYILRQLIKKSDSILMHFFKNNSNNGEFVVDDGSNETNNQILPSKITDSLLPTHNPSSNKNENLMQNENFDMVSLDALSGNKVLRDNDLQIENCNKLKLSDVTKELSNQSSDASNFIKQESSETTMNFEDSSLNSNSVQNLTVIQSNKCDSVAPSKLCKDEIIDKNDTKQTNLSSTTKRRQFTCQHCSQNFTKKCHLSKHMKNHEQATSVQHLCSFCGKLFENRYKLVRHVRLHTNDPPFKKKLCGICGKLFQTPFRFNRHYRIHTGERPFKCDICGASFNQLSTVKLHMRCHTKERPYKCKICGNDFTQSSSLYLHIRNQHQPKKKSDVKERPYTCQFCGNSFTQSSSLYLHIRTQHRENN